MKFGNEESGGKSPDSLSEAEVNGEVEQATSSSEIMPTLSLDSTFRSCGVEYPLTNHVDCLVADAQRGVAEAKAKLERVQGKDYEAEKRALRLLEGKKAYEDFTAKIASMESAEEGSSAELPGATAFLERAQEIWQSIDSEAQFRI